VDLEISCVLKRRNEISQHTYQMRNVSLDRYLMSTRHGNAVDEVEEAAKRLEEWVSGDNTYGLVAVVYRLK
jgi:hypothetical protein